MSELLALAKWKTTKCVIDVSLSHAMTLSEAQEVLDGIADYVDIARAAIAELEAELAATEAERFRVNVQAEQAEAALAKRDELLAMLEKGGVRIVSDGGSFTLAEFRQGITALRAHAGEFTDE